MALHLIVCGIVSTLLTYSSLIHTLHGQVSPVNSSPQQVNYVTPNKSMPCLTGQHPCLTIDEYAFHIDRFFLNDSIFNFLSGNHSLTVGLNISGIHNASFIGLPDDSVTLMVLNKSAYISWEDCKSIVITNIIFNIKSNFAYIISFESTSLVELTNITILGHGQNGYSSIISINSKIGISNSKFKGIKGYSGAALLASESNITFTGINLFIKNIAAAGGAMYICQSSSVLFTGISVFCNNSAAYNISAKNLICKGHREFFRYGSGGAISCDNSIITLSSSVISLNETMIRSHLIDDDISGILSLNNSNSVYLENNDAARYGGAIHLFGSSIYFCVTVSLKNNSASFGGAIHTSARSNVFFCINCSIDSFSSFSIIFQNNKATNRGGSIGSHDSDLYFMGSVLFDSNSADYGGAVILHGTSRVIFKSPLTLCFKHNRANKNGGAIYYHDSLSDLCEHLQIYREKCFLSYNSLENVSLLFINNSASLAGGVLYSGRLGECVHLPGWPNSSTLDNCYSSGQNEVNDLLSALANVSTISNNSHKEISALSADVESVKFCQHPFFSTNNVNEKNDSINIYPGQHFKIMLKAVTGSPYNFPARTEILLKIINDNKKNSHKIIKLVSVNLTNISTSCTGIDYYLTINHIKEETNIMCKFYHDNPCGSVNNGVTLDIHIKPCPLGFELSHKSHTCACNKWLQSLTDECNIDESSIERKTNTFWISTQANNSGLILHTSRCPFDFCKDQSVNVPLDNPSAQCDFNRSGTLCGQCREQYSLALGTLHCLKCVKSSYIALIIPFALVGIALVIGILLLHFTVDIGTLNSIIFYANIVHSNRQAYFQHTRKISNFHAIFISWLNLDFGIETCFYDGMDIYAYSWLQFLFPFYLWFLIGAIIFICRYSQRAARSLGQNPVAALATVLFLSYGKVLNAIIAPLSKTELMFSSNDGFNSTLSVWLYDGSVDYFAEQKHIALGLFAILILLLAFVPYTFILLCGHWLIAYSDKCCLLWLNKFKPVLDVYYAPFKQEARYWIGLTLLSRSALLLTIATNAVSSDSVNLLVIASVTAGLLSIKGRVYTHRYSDILETSFILNLCIFSIATFYLKERNVQNQLVILNISIGITFITLIGIVIFHIYLLLKSTHIWNICVISMFCKSKWLCKVFGIVQKEDTSLVLKSNDPKVVTSTLVELREPLIDNDSV